MLRHLRSPHIVIAETEHYALSVLAMSGSGHSADAADALNYELDRARIVDDQRLPADVVRMGSTVTFRIDEDAPCTATLVYPSMTNGARDRLSILTPEGTALIGLRSGQAIQWRSHDGTALRIEVLGVEHRRS